MAASPHRNRLADATSPYLQQHADNPVDWYPWSQEALGLARRENKPILLSIGYSACHWCHVMAHESFEDADTAALMNQHFISIKVDREERPDLDKIYQTAHQLLTQRPGGWPLTMFLSPGDQTPFFAGTYFPREPRHGLPGFKDILQRISELHQERGQEIDEQNQAMRTALARISASPGGNDALVTGAPLARAREELQHSFDPVHGGFGKAPKFPHPTNLERLLRHYAASLGATPDKQALHMACFSLRRMALGGLYDQVGGGFARYSVDDYWMIPHFEKMLYDNGQLLSLYADAWLATDDALYARVARETADWVITEMQSPEGGYYSSLDADSEGEEGLFYIWDRAELREILGPDNYQLLERRFGLNEAPNFEGRWHLHVHESFSELAKTLQLPRTQIIERWNDIRRRLYERRSQRVWPGRDEKVLTSWNALTIKGMARAGRLLDEPRYRDSARRALDFLRARLWRDGRLLASFKDGRATLPAYLDDHAFLLDALLEMLQTDWRDADLQWAQALAELLLEHFEDPEGGGFFFTADDHEQLIQRPRPLMDEATPSGNGVAAQCLQRLGYLLGEPRYLEAAERCLRSSATAVHELPHAHASLLAALEEHLQLPELVVLRGQGEVLESWHRQVQRPYAPRRLGFAIPAEAQLPPALAAKQAADAPVAYFCHGTRCSEPVTDAAELTARLRG